MNALTLLGNLFLLFPKQCKHIHINNLEAQLMAQVAKSKNCLTIVAHCSKPKYFPIQICKNYYYKYTSRITLWSSYIITTYNKLRATFLCNRFSFPLQSFSFVFWTYTITLQLHNPIHSITTPRPPPKKKKKNKPHQLKSKIFFLKDSLFFPLPNPSPISHFYFNLVQHFSHNPIPQVKKIPISRSRRQEGSNWK